MSAFDDLAGIGRQRIFDGVNVRAVQGERMTLSVVELDPGAIVPEHAHDNEQLGMVLSGSMRFRIGQNERDVRAGSTWSIPPNVLHQVEVGPEGCVVVECFAPGRDDWRALEPAEPSAPRWP